MRPAPRDRRGLGSAAGWAPRTPPIEQFSRPTLKEFIAANKEWLTVFHFPVYAPDLNPQEGIWSLVKRTIGNLAVANLDHLATAVKRSLRKTQYCPHLIDGCLAGTG